MDKKLKDYLKNSGDPERGKSMLARFDQSYLAQLGKTYDWSSPAAASIARIFGNSHALAERLVTHPRFADEIGADSFLTRQKPKEVMQSELEQLVKGDVQDLSRIYPVLRRFKYREMIRIVARDLEGKTPESEILHEWSDLADTLTSQTYDIALANLTERYGPSCPGTIIALGKLGGHELNLSSDIDVLFLYEKDFPATDDMHKTPHEFFVSLAKLVTDLLARTTEDGFIFRVDHDLRPEGPQGTLANSIDAAERYYEYFGQDWERQALIRARPVAGDINLGNQFIERIRPFVFRKALGMSDLAKMRKMKERMGAKSQREDTIDVKSGNGGIRSVEFLVQAMQMLYGGRIEKLKTPNTFTVIHELAAERLIHPSSAKRLEKSYSFLRRVENMLQAAQEQQIYALPSDEKNVAALARRLGYRGTDGTELGTFKNELKEHMDRIHRLFIGMFEADYERIELKEAIDENLSSCTDAEERMDSIPWFKHQEVRRIQHLDLEGKIGLVEVLRRLTLVAEVVIETAWKMAWLKLTDRYGTPCNASGSPAGFGILGMGKLGSQEIDYGSDLDLCFIYSGAGKTSGARSIDNSEFFTRLAQRIMSLISITSRYGKAYEVDSELRPSGGSGALVSTLDSFRDHHQNRSQPWERLALLRARVITGNDDFIHELKLALEEIAYLQYPPEEQEIIDQEKSIRHRIDLELLNEGESRFDLKYGHGGIHDLESVIHYIQLMHASHLPSLRTQNTFSVVEALHKAGLAEDVLYGIISEALPFYRLLLSRVRLYSGRSTNIFDAKPEGAKSIAESMEISDVDSLHAELKRHRNAVSSEYKKYFG